MRYFTLLATLVLFAPLSLLSQTPGCTNIWAINFNPDATQDDGSCDIYLPVISYDATLDMNIEVGTGISNMHMAIVDHGPIQYGIKINRRFISDVIPTNDIDYLAYSGYSRTSFEDPTPDVGTATWDFIYSFNLGDYDFDDLECFVSIDFDPLDSPGQAEAYELPVSFILQQLGQSDLSIRQGSENLGFGFWNGLAGPEIAGLFDPLNPGIYDLGLRVENKAGTNLGEVSIRVIVEDPVEGCTDETACNYDPSANLDDASCDYGDGITNCDGTCISDCDGDGVCDENEVYGCTYTAASNYNPNATDDDGSCEGFEGGSCLPGDLDNDSVVDLQDLLLFLANYGSSCIDVD